MSQQSLDREVLSKSLEALSRVPSDLAEAALHYAAHGLPVFPTNIKKKPLTAHGYKDATTDPAKIRAMFRNPRAAGVATPTGTITGLVVLDRDRKNGVDGVETCKALEADLGGLPPTLQQRTGSGGDQLLLLYPEGTTIKNSVGELGPNLDVRGVGGYINLPPSRNEAGTYAWQNNLDPAPLPQKWVDRMKERPRPEVDRKPAPTITAIESTPYGLKALEAECQAVASEPEGGRNHRTNQAAFVVGQLVGGGEIREEEGRLALAQAAAAAGLGEIETDKTIRSGMTAGMAEPRNANSATVAMFEVVPEDGESGWNPNGGQRAGKDAAKEAHAQECLAGIFNGADLLEMDLPEVRWAVLNLLPQGLAILAGGPKLGKSWLIYLICLAMGCGCRVLGHFQTPQAKSLYLALEDGKRRLQDRLKALCKNEPALKAGLANVDFQINWPRFDDEGGLEKLESYVEANVPEGLKLVVIDTLAKVGPKAKSKGLNAYENDSIIMTRIKSMADKHGICILIVTHLAKMRTSKDPFDSITGSMGQFGTADTAMLLARKRGAPTAILQTTGRDIEGHSYDLTWNDPGWSCTGFANEDEVDLSPERLTILRVFKDDGGALSPNMVAQTTGRTPSNTGKLIKKLVEEGFLFSVGYGMYSLIPSVPSGGSSPSVPSVPSKGGGLGQVGILGIDFLGNEIPDEVTL
jgi:hypothetical protein